jgi:NTE family protein
MPTPRKPKIGLALGAGGARGWAHIGAISALNAQGIRPDIVCGT